MGLIHQASVLNRENIGRDVEEKKTGLLEYLLRPSGYDLVRASFLSFLDDIKAERAGILFSSAKESCSFVFVKGFDVTTIHRFVPSTASMDSNTALLDEWESCFESEELEFFRPFFSSNEFQSLIALHVRKILLGGDTVAYIVIAESLKNSRREKLDLDSGDESFARLSSALSMQKLLLEALAHKTPIRQLPTAIKEHAQSALDAGKRATFFSVSFAQLFSDPVKVHTDSEQKLMYATMRDRIVRQAGSMNLVSVMDDNSIHIVIFSSGSVDSVLYFSQLMKPLEKLFGVERVKKIIFDVEGSSAALHEILAFLHGEA